MSNETLSVPNRRPGPHAPLPTPAPPTETKAETAASTPPVVVGEKDPRARAARRAMELREHLGTMEDGVDKFYVDPRIVPDGWSYEWKTHTILGKENPSYQVSLAHRGWEPVPRSRHPEMMPDNYTGNTIVREGMILMERPAEITDEVKAAEYRKARDQVKTKETQLNASPPGTFERDNKGKPMASVSRSYETIPIPK